MSRPFRLTPILLLFLVILGIEESASASEPDAVLFRPMSISDYVLLVEDPAEVAQLTERVLNNKRVPHACEGDWAIVFRLPDNVLKHSGHSEDHERYLHDDLGTHELLNGYILRFHNRKEEDKTILIRLTIGTDVPVEEAIEALESGGEKVFFFGSQTDRLPGMVLKSSASAPRPAARDQWDAAEANVEAQADALLEEGIEVVKQWRPVVSTTPIGWISRSYGQDEYKTNKEVTLHFPFGTDLSDTPVLPVDVVLGEVFVPEEYFINIVLPADGFDEMRESLPGKYPFVRDVMTTLEIIELNSRSEDGHL